MDKTTNCPHPVGFFVLPNGEKSYAPCGRWDCPHCSAVKKNRVLDRANNGFTFTRKGFRIRFLTLTLANGAKNEDMGKYWNRLRASLRKNGYKHFQFFWTKELTEKGKVHMHILMDAYVPKKEIKRLWYLATEETSYIVKIKSPESLKIKNAAAYMTKYLTKSMGSRLGKNKRKYGFSRHKGFRVQQYKAPMEGVKFVMDNIWDKPHYRRCMNHIGYLKELNRLRSMWNSCRIETFI
jgi:hypothetical protein